jgi:hypothetical protein
MIEYRPFFQAFLKIFQIQIIEKIVINHVKNHDSGVNRENDSIQEASNQGIKEFGIIVI